MRLRTTLTALGLFGLLAAALIAIVYNALAVLDRR